MLNKNINKLNKKANIAVIGSGFAGLTSAAMLGAAGAAVTIFEKNTDLGGRARTMTIDGFVFDMGPSWYWMPDVYEKYFNLFGHTTSDFYELKKLDPGFRVVFGIDDYLDVPENFEQLCTLFESIEKGSAMQLRKFMKQAAYKYSVGMNNMVYLPSHSLSEYFSLRLLKDAFKLQLFSSFSKHIRSFFKNPRLLALMEFPVLFLGAMPKDTPALYSLMNYSGLKQGTFYPLGGFGKVVDAFQKIAEEQGVTIKTNERVERLEIKSGNIINLHSNGAPMAVDAVVASADYHHVEKALLPQEYRTYDEAYWNKKVFAPSCLIFYLGVNKKIEKLIHHNLFFDEDLNQHAIEIYESKKWPSNPLFYVCCPSKTDSTVAPEGCENLFVLMPVAAGLDDTEEIRTHYYDMLMSRLEKFTGEEIRAHVTTKKTYSVSNFKADYNAYKGNAYGLANTLMQTAIFKPKLKSRKVNNLFFAGQLTVPGPGVPPSIISGQIAANELLKSITLQPQN
ncbi:MAG: phytoene desaturase family protein [Bacteroidetes bacterium]|nr:phytoene desaturase family protein [Bacteroidota bacterium]